MPGLPGRSTKAPQRRRPPRGTGNGTLIAGVTSQSNTSANAKAGIIWKRSTTAGSPYILIAVGAGSIKVQYNFNTSVNAGTYTFPKAWLKLTRIANTFTAYVSGDGVAWTQVAAPTLAFTPGATAGRFVCSLTPTSSEPRRSTTSLHTGP